MTINNNGRPPSAGQQNDENSHEQEIEEREAYQYWGYLFKPDKTGTDKLKGLLRGLKQLMVCYIRHCNDERLANTIIE